MPLNEADFQVRGVRDPQLAVHATGMVPAWLWAADGTRILWANPAGCALFGASRSSTLAQRAFGPADQHRRQIARLATQLPLDGTTRLERLRGFGMPLGLLVTCACTRLIFTGGGNGILIAAVEPFGRILPYDVRVQRLIEDIDAPIAAFTPTGTLIGINITATDFIAAKRMNGSIDLVALGLESAFQSTLESGTADVTTPAGSFALHRVGQGIDTAVLAFIALAMEHAQAAETREDTALPETPEVMQPSTCDDAGILSRQAERHEADEPLHEEERPVPTIVEAPPLSVLSQDNTVSPQDAVDFAAPDVIDAAPAPTQADAPQQPALPVDPPEDNTPEIALASIEPTPVGEIDPVADEPLVPATHDTVAAEAEVEAMSPLPSGEASVPARRHPLRFMWQMDADGRFSLGSDEFSRLIGPRTATAFGRPWSEIVALFGIDPDDRVAAAVATRNTWSGVVIDWPADGIGSRLPVELSGLPVYDKTRQFLGYRGFGVCRDLEGLNWLAVQRQNDVISPDPAFRDPAAETAPDGSVDSSKAAPLRLSGPDVSLSMQTKTDHPVDTPENVVPFPSTSDPKVPTLTPGENNAFNELAKQLAARLEAEHAQRDGLNNDVLNKKDEPSLHPTTKADDDEGHENTPPQSASEAASKSSADTEAELGTILDATDDGILIFDTSGRIATCNRGAEIMFGFDETNIALHNLTDLFAPASRADVLAHLMNLTSTEAGQQNLEAQGLTRTGETLALSLKTGRTLKNGSRFFAICRRVSQKPPIDIDDTRQSKRQADRVAHARSDILARISHEIRTPLSAIIGFADIMIDERFGAIGNERYASYLKDIRGAGERVLALINDLLDLSRIETGKLDLTFTRQDLNDMVEKCVSAMQPQANRERIIIRTSLAHALPQVTVDAGSLRQIVMNLVGNSIHVAKAGGQVIVSTALTDLGDVVLRVRDTGRSLSYSEMEAALEQFRNPAADQLMQDNAGINLSLTRALVEANLAQFHIKSAPQSGTLVEVSFSQKAAQAI
jgi:PAS domain S-box-containing protein